MIGAVSAFPLVLGSASPRRRELLAQLGVKFEVVAGDADESIRLGEPVGSYLERVVEAKLANVRDRVATRWPRALVLVADTCVVCGPNVEDLLAKPTDRLDACRMLELLAGRTHEVWTRFTLGAADGRIWATELVASAVTFRALSAEEIDAYVATDEGSDKAGAYAIQGRAGAFVSRIEGSYSGIVGLPLCEVSVALALAGLSTQTPGVDAV